MKAIKYYLQIVTLLLSLSYTAAGQTTSLRANEIHVEILFEAEQVTIIWNTAKEINTSYFVVEKSADSLHYTPIKMISAAGNSVFSRSYSVTEMELTAGKVYYRVRLITMNGQQIASTPVMTNTGTFSNIVSK